MVLGVAAVALIVGGVVVAATQGGSGASGASEDRPGPADQPVDGLTPEAAVRAATDRLEAAGTFAYAGTVGFSFPDDPEPGMRRPVTDGVEGVIDLPDRSLERVSQYNGDTLEHLMIGTERWSRWSFLADQVDERPWITETPDPVALEAPAIMRWLTASTRHEDDGTDTEGRRTIRATVPATELPPGSEDGVLQITLSEDGDVIGVAIQVADSRDGSLFEASYELSRVGEPVEIMDPPTADEINHTPTVNEEDIAASGVDPIGLAPPPAGWELVGGFVQDVGSGCRLLNLDYSGPDEAGVELDVTVPECAIGRVGGEPFRAGDLSGTIAGDSASSAGAVTVGSVTVAFVTRNVPDPGSLLAALGPIDPAVQAAAHP